jgi:DNA-binding response OmpR family regulator
MTMTRTFLASSQFEEQQMLVSDIQWNCEQHSIKIGPTLIALTATEYRLLYPLRTGVPITYADLAWIAYNYSVDDKVRTMMDKHIDRIRGKLRGTGIYIYCVLGYGYLLLSEVLPDDAGYNMSS